MSAKNMMHSLYIKHHPDNRHKMAKELAIQVGDILKKSYMDDVNCATSATEIAKEIEESTFRHPEDFKTMAIQLQTEWITIAKWCRINAICDFSGMHVKSFSCTSLMVQSKLNQDKRTELHKKTHKENRPSQELLTKEILRKRKAKVPYANKDFPLPREDTHTYLGLQVCRKTENIFLKPKPLFLRTKQRGPVDITILNIGELKTYIAQKGFTRANLATLVASLYCPMATLNAIYSNVA